MIFEHRHEKLLPLRRFYLRMALYALAAAGILSASLAIGILGYHLTEGMPWLDSFLNAAMIMGGMGPVGALRTDAGKIFAGCYALYCGIVLLASVGVLFAPVIHRFLHRLHIDAEKDEG